MGLDYTMVHVYYNIPLGVALTILSWPFLTRMDWIKTLTLITVAIIGTIPWDSYLVPKQIWTYPPSAVLGFTLFSIPLEEVFFFFIQTYNTSLIYMALTRRLVFPAYLCRSSPIRTAAGSLFISILVLAGFLAIFTGGHYTYLGLILSWACSFLLLQWALSSGFLLALPWKEMVFSVIIPTFFLWMVDTLALQRGHWVIEKPTKLEIQLWGGLDMEEALFFLLTNALVVNGMVVADHAIALMHCRQAQSVGVVHEGPPCTHVLVDAINSTTKTDKSFVSSLAHSVKRLSYSSQSMYLGSAMFQGALRIDLIYLYAFCRVADDLVDEASSQDRACAVIEDCSDLLTTKFVHPSKFRENIMKTTSGLCAPRELVDVIDNLPVSRLTLQPLQGLLEGFRIDLGFDTKRGTFPIANGTDLDCYSYRVASTVARCILDLVFHHYPSHPSATDPSLRRDAIFSAEQMGKALQYVNMARDIGRDAAINRVYLPTTWLKEIGLSPADVIFCPSDPRIEKLRYRLINQARRLYDESEAAIQYLPVQVQGPLRATVATYMEIGAVLEEGVRPRRPWQKLKLSLGRRFVVAYMAMGKVAFSQVAAFPR
ncbi:phytoene synthase [Aspergillus steynii IBT 23096]|uniref:Bifunctional lycopene cyclase/phytoene synthase n=1 Tax=Aspergillus steynii IBT 23096 TaxID=1392250 RepID=A0A2I2GEY5_9EURO|nr:phytoene synthase [Aspergillus steynii IBT 23096]PLB51387.1 phytoene synthase [Aspergillus steynii IBT 23096]